MSELISRQAAIDALGEEPMVWCNENEYELGERNQWNSDVLAIKAVPSVQPEIIRCKDCKYYEIWQLKSDYTDDKRYKPSVCVRGQYAVHHSPDWFCADAERREDG